MEKSKTPKILVHSDQSPKPEVPTESSTKNRKNTSETCSFKKGHRRCTSMPMPTNAQKGECPSTSTAVEPTANGDKFEHKHRVLRHRHVRLPTQNGTSAATARGPTKRKHPDFDVIEMMEEEDNVDVPIHEEEMMRFPGIAPNEGNLDSERHSVHKKFWQLKLLKFWQLNWKPVHFTVLPTWLQDNKFIHFGHRPQLPTFGSCFKSIFALHTETGNIWTHIYGAIAFLGAFIWLLIQKSDVIGWRDKLIFSPFFVGAILCMAMSSAFHTVQCHSENVGQLFSKLDYAGISLLIIGSFVPWLYYAFYCRALPMAIYISMIVILGIAAIVVSLWDKFAEPKFRPIRAIVFMAMGLSSVVPAIHLMITDGFEWMFHEASLHWLILMGALYIFGASIYMIRFPERFFPGKCDLLCQSHQIFHLFVIFAAAVHYHGLLELAMKRLEDGSCSEQLIERGGSDEATIDWLDDKIRPY